MLEKQHGALVMEFRTKIKLTVETNRSIFAASRDEATKKAKALGEKLFDESMVIVLISLCV